MSQRLGSACVSLPAALLSLSLLLFSGCTSEKKIDMQGTKIGDGSAAPAVAAPPAAAPASTPVAANPAKAEGTSNPNSGGKRKRRKDEAADLELSDDGDLPPNHAKFAVLDADNPGGTPFRSGIAQDADRYAARPSDPQFNSTRFAYAPGRGPAGVEGVGWMRDDSQTEYELPEGFTPIEETGNSASGLPWRIRCEKDGAVMALVPEGAFLQGSDAGPANASPEHAVVLDAYYIDLREVTAARYETYRESVNEKRRVPKAARTPNDPQEPVLGVTWAEAHAFAQWAGKDLPTEAQWEKAARGTEGFKFPWGNGVFVWDRPRQPAQIDKVGSFRGDVSPCGAWDMAGNAREWCADWYTDKYYVQLVAEGGSTIRNPTGPKASGGTSQRVVKGGDPDWFVFARAGVVQTEHPNDVGFRCVLKLKPKGTGGGKKKGSK